jgi:hypothetical protein
MNFDLSNWVWPIVVTLAIIGFGAVVLVGGVIVLMFGRRVQTAVRPDPKADLVRAKEAAMIYAEQVARHQQAVADADAEIAAMIPKVAAK